MSISSGSSLMLTSKRSCTSLRILASFSSDTNVIAKPLVPKRPALATWKEKGKTASLGEDGEEVHSACAHTPEAG